MRQQEGSWAADFPGDVGGRVVSRGEKPLSQILSRDCQVDTKAHISQQHGPVQTARPSLLSVHTAAGRLVTEFQMTLPGTSRVLVIMNNKKQTNKK